MNRVSMGFAGLSVILVGVVWTLNQEVSNLRESLLKTDQQLATCNLERTRQGVGGLNTDGRAAKLRAVQSSSSPNPRPERNHPASSGLSGRGINAASAKVISTKALGRWKAEHRPKPDTFMHVYGTVDQWFNEITDIEKRYHGGLIDEQTANDTLRETSARYQKDLEGVLGKADFKPFWNETRLNDVYPRVPGDD